MDKQPELDPICLWSLLSGCIIVVVVVVHAAAVVPAAERRPFVVVANSMVAVVVDPYVADDLLEVDFDVVVVPTVDEKKLLLVVVVDLAAEIVVGRLDVVVVVVMEEETSYVDVAAVVKINVAAAEEMVNVVVVAFVVVVEAMTFVEKVLASDAVVKQIQMLLLPLLMSEMIQKMMIWEGMMVYLEDIDTLVDSIVAAVDDDYIDYGWDYSDNILDWNLEKHFLSSISGLDGSMSAEEHIASRVFHILVQTKFS